MVGHGGRSAGSYLTDPTSPNPSHCASIVATSTVRVNMRKTSCDIKSSTVSVHLGIKSLYRILLACNIEMCTLYNEIMSFNRS